MFTKDIHYNNSKNDFYSSIYSGNYTFLSYIWVYDFVNKCIINTHHAAYGEMIYKTFFQGSLIYLFSLSLALSFTHCFFVEEMFDVFTFTESPFLRNFLKVTTIQRSINEVENKNMILIANQMNQPRGECQQRWKPKRRWRTFYNEDHNNTSLNEMKEVKTGLRWKN